MLILRASFFKKHLKNKMFNKIFLLYSIIVIISLTGLSFFTSRYLAQTTKEKELHFNKQVLDSIVTYMNGKYVSVQNIITNLYRNNDIYMDITQFLTSDFKGYTSYRMNQYLSSSRDTIPNFKDYIHSILLQDADIIDVILYSEKQKFFHITSGTMGNSYSIYSKKAKQLAEKSFHEETLYPSIFKGVERSDFPIPQTNQQIYGIIHGINDPDTREKIGEVIIHFDTEGIYKLYQKYGENTKGYILIMTSTGRVIYDSSSQYDGQIYPYASQINNTGEPVLLEERSYVNLVTSPIEGLTMVGIIPESDVLDSIKVFLNTIKIMTLALILGSVFLTYFAIYVFQKRTKVITSAIQQLESGNLSVRIPIGKGEDELKEIAMNFNTMCESLNSYIQKVYISEIAQKNAQLLALQTQVNPHFLYNTLEVIRMKAISQGSHEAGEMIYIMATLYRHVVQKDMFIPIADEAELCAMYLELFSLRYEDGLSFTINIKEDIELYYIPKFTLQPLIENYIVHGINIEEQNNSIDIIGYQEEDHIILKVQDNGKGIQEEKLARIIDVLEGVEPYPSRKSIGLPNVNERLKMIFGKDYGMKISSQENMGTCICIKIPVKTKEDLLAYVEGAIS